MTQQTTETSPRVAGHRQLRRVSMLLFLILMASLTIGSLFSAGRANGADMPAPEGQPGIVAQCKADLARRLTVQPDDVQLLLSQPVTWPDSALGLPEMDKGYAEMLTPGWKIVLASRGMNYLYTASAETFKYGGPAPLWSSSMLMVLPIEDEPNMNGDLYQLSLIGSNPEHLITGVSAFYPQQDGAILFTRRTSRSGHDLLLFTLEQREPRRLHAAFDFGEASWDNTRKQWAAYVRPKLGDAWQINIAGTGAHWMKPLTMSLPAGTQPLRIAWAGTELMVLVNKGEATLCYASSPLDDNPTWREAQVHTFPGMKSYALNKSETLDVREITKDGKPAVEVSRLWFTGDRKVKATIAGLSLRGYDLLESRFLLIWGEQDGQSALYTVDSVTSEVMAGYHGAGQQIKPFDSAPQSQPTGVTLVD